MISFVSIYFIDRKSNQCSPLHNIKLNLNPIQSACTSSHTWFNLWQTVYSIIYGRFAILKRQILQNQQCAKSYYQLTKTLSKGTWCFTRHDFTTSTPITSRRSLLLVINMANFLNKFYNLLLFFSKTLTSSTEEPKNTHEAQSQTPRHKIKSNAFNFKTASIPMSNT